MLANFCIAFSLALYGLACASGNEESMGICAEGLKLIKPVLKLNGPLSVNWDTSLSSLSNATGAMLRQHDLQRDWMQAELNAMEVQLATSSSATEIKTSCDAARAAKDAYDRFCQLEMPTSVAAAKKDFETHALNVVNSFKTALHQKITSGSIESGDSKMKPEGIFSVERLQWSKSFAEFDAICGEKSKEMLSKEEVLRVVKHELQERYNPFVNSFKKQELQQKDIELARNVVHIFSDSIRQVQRQYCILYVAILIAHTQLDIFLRAYNTSAAVMSEIEYQFLGQAN